MCPACGCPWKNEAIVDTDLGRGCPSISTGTGRRKLSQKIEANLDKDMCRRGGTWGTQQGRGRHMCGCRTKDLSLSAPNGRGHGAARREKLVDGRAKTRTQAVVSRLCHQTSCCITTSRHSKRRSYEAYEAKRLGTSLRPSSMSGTFLGPYRCQQTRTLKRSCLAVNPTQSCSSAMTAQQLNSRFIESTSTSDHTQNTYML